MSARYPVAVLRATCCPLPEGAVQAACCGSVVAFSDHCALSEPVGCGIFGSAGIFSVCMSLRVACPLLPQSDVCSPACMDFSGSVFCAECHPLSYDHPCSYRKWLGKQAKGVGGGHGRENVPLPLPTPQTHQEVFFTCRMRTGPNGARGWERARAWNHPSRPDRAPPPHSHQPSGSCCEAQSGLGALRSAPPTSPCRSIDLLDASPPPARARGGSCPFRTTSHPLPQRERGRAYPRRLCLCPFHLPTLHFPHPSPDAPMVPGTEADI